MAVLVPDKKIDRLESLTKKMKLSKHSSLFPGQVLHPRTYSSAIGKSQDGMFANKATEKNAILEICTFGINTRDGPEPALWLNKHQ